MGGYAADQDFPFSYLKIYNFVFTSLIFNILNFNPMPRHY